MPLKILALKLTVLYSYFEIENILLDMYLSIIIYRDNNFETV